MPSLPQDVLTLSGAVKFWSENYGDKDAFVFLNRHGRHSTYTYRDLFQIAGKFSARLHRSGCVPGDIIANAIPNSPERLITDIGIILAGCVTVNCQVVEKDGSDFFHVARTSRCKAVIVPKKENNSAFTLFSQFFSDDEIYPMSGCVAISVPQAPELTKAFMVARKGPQISEVGEKRTRSFTESLLVSEGEAFLHTCAPTDLVVLLATSGSTGYSKLIPRTHQEVFLLSPNKNMGNFGIYNSRPLGWMGGFPISYYIRAVTVYLEDCLEDQQTSNGLDLWRLLESEDIRRAVILPDTILDVAKVLKDPVTSSPFRLDFLFTGGQPSKKNVLEACSKLATTVVMAYGSSELLTISKQIFRDPAQVAEYSCGRAEEDVHIRIVDETLQDLPPASKGKILFKSPKMFRHYYNYTPSTPVFTPDGYFITGDRGMLDKEGTLYVYGRDGDILSQGSILIYFSWPESILAKCPGVEEVTMICLPQQDGDDQLCACVKPRENSNMSEDDVMRYFDDAQATDQGEFKVVLHHAVFFEEFPQTYTGKLNKRELMRIVQKKLGQML